MKDLKNQIESILFISAKPLSDSDLSKILEKDLAEVKQALSELVSEKKAAGVVVLEANGHFQLATNSANSTQVKNFLQAELREKLTDATIETLAIIAYRQPISRAEIEAIRGVNSQYSIRALLMRGLVEKIPNPHDARVNYYQVTTEFLQHLGLSNVSDLSDFQTLVKEVKLPEVAATRLEDAPSDTEAAPPLQESTNSPASEEIKNPAV